MRRMNTTFDCSVPTERRPRHTFKLGNQGLGFYLNITHKLDNSEVDNTVVANHVILQSGMPRFGRKPYFFGCRSGSVIVSIQFVRRWLSSMPGRHNGAARFHSFLSQNESDRRLRHMTLYPRHVGQENGGREPLGTGRAPLVAPSLGGHSCKNSAWSHEVVCVFITCDSYVRSQTTCY